VKPTFFETPAEFRLWLQKHHARETELLVGFHKKGTGKPSLTWPESVEEALCFGWIDGVRKSLGEESYVIRFSPRKAGSIWSDINSRKAQELIDQGRMAPAGLAAFKLRDPKRAGVYSFEQKQALEFPPESVESFKGNARAWSFFEAQAPSYRKAAIHWVVSAKQEPTRERRLATLISDSAKGRQVAPLRRRP
jgi:uncharacterized protein YdeI (YjbR/CyaY-like superfamily)